MVSMGSRTRSPALTGDNALGTLEALIQTELGWGGVGWEDDTSWVSGCRECLGPLYGTGGSGGISCERCTLVEMLSHQVKEMQEEVSRLQIIGEDNEEIDRVFAETLQRQQPEPHTARKEGQLETMVKQIAEGGCQDGEG